MKWAALAAVAVLSVSAFAQGGGRPGGGRGMQMGGMMTSEAVLVGRPDVQKDLKLTDEQKTKLTAIQTEMGEKMRAQFQNRGGGTNGGEAGTRGGFDMQEIQKQMEAMQKEANEKVKGVLTPEQWTRLGQIKVQLGGSRLFLEDEFSKKLGLKAAQKMSIQELMDKQQAANQQIWGRMREEGVDRAKLMVDLRKNDEILRAEIEKLLTEEQKTTLKTLEGPKFEADPNIQNNPFGGRGGGGGFGGRGGGTGGGTGGGGR
jgi:hypothetical protein